METAKNLDNKTRNSGFTLTEMSIVITIIGLLVSGIMAGSALTKSTQLQNVIKEIKEYDTAINQFKEKFKYYPGDFPNATSYWPTASNGDGNWYFKYIIEGSNEGVQFWMQLNLAGLIAGSYTGVAATPNRFTPGVNVPSTGFANNGFYAIQSFNDTGASVDNNYTGIFSTHGNSMMLATSDQYGGPWGIIMNSEDAYSIDTKIDDGQPATGNLYANNANNATGSCASQEYTYTGPQSNVTYMLADSSISCRLFWWLDKNN